MLRNLDFITQKTKEELHRLFGDEPAEHEICNFLYSKVNCELPLDETFFTAISTFFKSADIKGLNVWLSSFSSFSRDGIGYFYISFDYEDLDPEVYEEEDGSFTTAMDYREQVIQKFFNLDNVLNYKVRRGGYGFFTLNYTIKI